MITPSALQLFYWSDQRVTSLATGLISFAEMTAQSNCVNVLIFKIY